MMENSLIQEKIPVAQHRVSDPDPYWIRIQSGQWIRIIKALDPVWIRIRIGLQPQPLDPDPLKMNTDPKHWRIIVEK
jgi:hypothetical protein